MQYYSPSIPKENFSAMTRLDQNRATAQLAAKAGVGIAKVDKCIIWGNHSSTQFPDMSQATINGKNAMEVVNDKMWAEGTFVTTVQKRGGAVIAARKLSSAMSAAKAASDHMKDWFQGTNGRWVSMGVLSDGSYGAPKDVMFSFPCTCRDGQWSIIQGLEISDFAKSKLEATGKELLQEKDEALIVCKESS